MSGGPPFCTAHGGVVRAKQPGGTKRGGGDTEAIECVPIADAAGDLAVGGGARVASAAEPPRPSSVPVVEAQLVSAPLVAARVVDPDGSDAVEHALAVAEASVPSYQSRRWVRMRPDIASSRQASRDAAKLEAETLAEAVARAASGSAVGATRLAVDATASAATSALPATVERAALAASAYDLDHELGTALYNANASGGGNVGARAGRATGRGVSKPRGRRTSRKEDGRAMVHAVAAPSGDRAAGSLLADGGRDSIYFEARPASPAAPQHAPALALRALALRALALRALALRARRPPPVTSRVHSQASSSRAPGCPAPRRCTVPPIHPTRLAALGRSGHRGEASYDDAAAAGR